jgi:hypothetical protein
LVCASVFEGTQAHYYADYLPGAELIAVNGERTMYVTIISPPFCFDDGIFSTLSEFEESLVVAQERCAIDEGEIIVITVSFIPRVLLFFTICRLW